MTDNRAFARVAGLIIVAVVFALACKEYADGKRDCHFACMRDHRASEWKPTGHHAYVCRCVDADGRLYAPKPGGTP